MSGFSLQARCAPGAPGCFPCLFFPLPRFGFGAGAVFPGRSSADGGIPEFPEFRDTARSSLASRSASSATCAVSSRVPRLQDLDQHALDLSQHGEIVISADAVTARHHPRSSRRASTQTPRPQRKRDLNLHQPAVDKARTGET